MVWIVGLLNLKFNQLEIDMITQERLKELLNYDLETGLFTWLQVKPRLRSRVAVGSLAGSINSTGYPCITLDTKKYYAHRLAFLYVTGEFPVNDVDHQDHNRANNQWDNLRVATRSENQRNQTMGKDNKSGFTGVCRHKACEKWVATIHVSGKLKYLGIFKDINDAITARKQANIDYGFHANHGSL